MKRSSSKVITRARSLRNLNKQGFRFRFTLSFETVDKLLAMSDVVLSWERGAKAVCTRATRIDKNTRVANFANETLSQEITLFKRKKAGSNFEDKVYRLAVRQGNERGKVLARIDLNFAEYVEIPTFSKRMAASLSNGGNLIMGVKSDYLGEASGKKSGSTGSNSVGSSAFTEDDFPEEDLDNDLRDLDIDDNAAPPLRPTPARPSPPSRESSVDNGVARSASMKKRTDATQGKLSSSVSRTEQRGANLRARPAKRTTSATEEGATSAPTPSRADFDRLRKENRALKRSNDELAERVEQLEHELGVGDADSLREENIALRRDIEELKSRLAREPVYADVVRELREAKMALAILAIEKDEMRQELRTFSK